MRRRDFLVTGGVAALGLSAFPLGWTAAADGRRKRVLFFTRSAGFEHSAIRRKGAELGFAEKVLVELGKTHGFDVECSKDGALFDGDLSKYDVFAFYTSGDLTKPDAPGKPVNGAGTKPMSVEGKKRFLDAIAGGKGYVGFHSANDSFHSPGGRGENSAQLDPYIAMVGGEFIVHGAQQEATLRIASPNFPGVKGLGESVKYLEEWYTLKNFAKDLHVVLVQETAGMKGDPYDRPPYPATWARMHGQGRVYYSSFGHRDDIWTNPQVQQILLGGLAWTLRNVDADVTPNLEQVAPKANQLPVLKPKAKAEGKKPEKKKEKKK